MNELISIIVPVYNVEKYLEKCLNSLINQTYKNLEIICVNDGSKDNGLAILKEYQAKDERIVVIDKQNEGASIARNVALERVTGDYLMFVDSDDWIEENTCEIALKTIHEESADLVMWPYVKEYSDTSQKKEIFNEDKIVFDKERTKELHRRLFGLMEKELKHPENADALCTIWGKLYKTSFIKNNKIGFFDIKKIGSYEDGLFNIEVFANLEKVVYINEYFSHYRKDNVSSVTTVFKKELAQQRQTLFDWMANYIKANNYPQRYKLALDNRISFSVLDIGLNLLSSDKSKKEQKREIKEYLKSSNYKNAIKNLKLKYFKIHWKLFYWCAKHECVFGIYLLLKIIKKIVNK